MGDAENYLVLEEKVKNTITEIDKVNDKVDRVSDKVDKLEEKTNKMETGLGERLTKMETRSEIWNEMTNKNIANIDHKLDSIIENKNKTEKKDDSFKDFAIKIGMKIIEYGILAGVLYGVGQNIKM